ncbi:MAG: acetoacetate decarboxylase family protein [Polyangiaceae bacterium]|nr:acetoacetate decarboxylase family protein [Polyangiaceae bacterium]
MHGQSVMWPVLVRASEVQVPAPLQVIARGGFAMGVLAYVRYEPPSPLCYEELCFMPCLVEARAAGRRRRGYFVARMYVDSEASLAGGREIWGLPKSLARFTRHGSRVEVSADDGSELTLELGRVGPGLRSRTRATTLQSVEGCVVRFRGDFRARVAPTSVRVARFTSAHPAWRGFPGAVRLPRPGLALTDFDAVMQEPERLG